MATVRLTPADVPELIRALAAGLVTQVPAIRPAGSAP